MKKLLQPNRAAERLDDMKALVDSLPLEKRKRLIAALKEVFGELENTAECGAEQGARVHAS